MSTENKETVRVSEDEIIENYKYMIEAYEKLADRLQEEGGIVHHLDPEDNEDRVFMILAESHDLPKENEYPGWIRKLVIVGQNKVEILMETKREREDITTPIQDGSGTFRKTHATIMSDEWVFNDPCSNRKVLDESLRVATAMLL